MLTQEMLGQIETLREQKVTYEKISESFGTSANEAYYNYNFYALPFAKAFDLIVKELKLYEMAVYRKDCQELLCRILSRLKKYTKFKNVRLLAPIVVYTVFRSKGMTIKTYDFCRVSGISIGDFKEGLFIVNPVYFEYVKPDREKFVSQLIAKMITKFNLDSTFWDTTKKIIRTFLPLFKNTKDNIAAGLIITLSFVLLDYELPLLSDVFEALGTDITRAHYHLRNRIFLPNQLGGFKGFAKSREKLKQFLLTKI